MDYIAPGDELAIDINGQAIPTEVIACEWSSGKDTPPVCRLVLRSPPAIYGDNELGMTLVRSASKNAKEIVMNEVEVIVKAAG